MRAPTYGVEACNAWWFSVPAVVPTAATLPWLRAEISSPTQDGFGSLGPQRPVGLLSTPRWLNRFTGCMPATRGVEDIACGPGIARVLGAKETTTHTKGRIVSQ